jgi:nucleoside-diphosphate-sugar epimerase
VVLRLAGIYGPSRVPNRADLLEQKPLPFDPTSALNLIHVDDAASIVLAAEKSAPVPRTYVVSDGHPVARGDYYAELAKLWHAPPPLFAAPGEVDPSSGNAIAPPRRGGADKRIDTTRLMSELAPALEFPDFQAGLRGIIELERCEK